MTLSPFHDDRNAPTPRASSSSGGGPEPFDKESGAFSDSWDWGIVVEPLREGETATCHLTLGVDDNGSLTVDGQGVSIGPRGQYHGGTYKEDTASFPISPGPHQAHLSYENVSLPEGMKNLAILSYSVEIEVSGSSSSSSYKPDEGYPDPIDTDDDGEDTPCECSSSTSPSSDSQSSSSCPCPQEENGEGDNGEDPETEDPCACEDNAGGSGSGSAPSRMRSSLATCHASAAGRRVVIQTRKAEMIWRTNFGSFRGMTGLPQGLLEIVGRAFSPELWTPRALNYWHPMVNEITATPPAGIGANTAFQIKSGSTNVNYYSYASGSGGHAGANYVSPIGGSTKRGGSASFGEVAGSNARSTAGYSLNVRTNAGHTVSYAGATASSLRQATNYVSKNGATYTREEFDGKLDIVRAADGGIRQIRNLWDGLANIENVTGNGYTIALYLPDQVGEKNPSTGLYPVAGIPFKTFSISGETATGKLKIVEQTAGRAPYATRYWQGADGAWNMSQGEGEDAVYTLKEKQTLSADAWKLVTTIRRGESGSPISRVCETFAVTRNGNLCTSRIEGYGTDYARETTYEYNGMGKLAKETAPDGSVKTWSYDRFGREIVATVPWAGGGGKATYTSYRDNAQADPDILAQRVTLTVSALDLWETKYAYVEENHVRRVEKRTTALGAEGERLEIKETWLGTAPDIYARGRLKMKQAIDGVQTHYAYEPADQYGALYRVTAETRIAGEAVPGHSTRKVTYVSEQGNNTRYEQYALLTDGTWAMTDAAGYEYDSENRWTKRTRANGRVYERAMMCCGPLWEKDEDGVLTTYSYNTARQLIEAIRSDVADEGTVVTPETIVSYTRDALGKITARRKDIGPMSVTELRSFDLLGRLVTETDLLGRVTTHTYSDDGLTETVVTSMGGTLITQKHPDGTVLRRYGTGQRDIRSLIEATTRGIRTTAAVPDDAEGTSPVMTNSATMNGFGDTVRITTANTVNEGAERILSYNDKGRLVREQLADMAPTCYEYGDFGNRTKETVALDDEPTMLNSRVTEYAYAQEQREDGVYRVVTVTTYAADGTPVEQKQAALLSALSSTLESKIIVTDARGHDTMEWTEYGGASIRLQKKSVPGVEHIAQTRIVDGFTTSVTGFDGATASRQRTYAATAITLAVTDVRGNVSAATHDAAGRILTDTDAAGNVTRYAYEQPCDLPTCVTNALGKTACAFYDIRGRKEAEWGTAIQPAVYTWNDADQIVALTTFRVSDEIIETDPRERTDGDTTTWAYDTATGLVTRKTYADGTRVDTAYDVLNRVATTTNARGTKTTYSYAPLTGELDGIVFDDGITPAIACQYNHLCQIIRVSDAGGTRAFAYNSYGEQESETTAGLAAGVLTTTRDFYGRSSGYSLRYGNAAALQTAWAFDDAGRLKTVSLNDVAVPFTYGYNVQNGLLDTLDYPNTLKRWYTREAKRDLLINIDYLRPYAANYPAKTDYAYDELGRPTTKKDYFNTPNPDLTHAYSYNGRNELTADAMSRGGTYGYEYDNIGNRGTSQEGTAAPATAYATNALNQYVAITEEAQTPFLPEYDADGNQTKVKTATGEWAVAYNALNQAVAFTQGDKRIECAYDYLNRRVEKAVYEGERLMSKKRFLYNGYLQIAELDAASLAETAAPVLRKTYLWDPLEPIATRVLAMSLFDESGTYVEDLYYTHDALKNTTALFGIKAGRRALYEFGPYGNIVKMEGDAAELNPFRFSSEFFDEETGLIQFIYRYYNVDDGRWVHYDPMMSSNLYKFSANSTSLYFDFLGLYKESTVDWLKENCYYIRLFASWQCVDPVAVSMAMAEEYDDYLSLPIKWLTDKVQDNIIENLFPDNGYFYSGDIGPVNIHFATAVKYRYESTLGRSATFGQTKDYIRTDVGAIEFSAIIMNHVINDLANATNGVVYPQNPDKELEKLQRNQIHANAFRQGIEEYLKKVRKNKQGKPEYVTDPGISAEELRKRYKQIQCAICECMKK